MFKETEFSDGKNSATYNLNTKNKLKFVDFVIDTVYDIIKKTLKF